jgi:galactokinase
LITVEAPGRINLIGEHIDYNGGYVLPGCIDKRIKVSIFEHNKKYCSVHSKTLNEKFNFYANKTNKSSVHWQNYILGTVDYFNKKGLSISPFHLEISSNLPIGAGISSSSALISAVAKSLINLFEFKLNKEHIIDSVSYVEKKYLGLNGGVMDQFTINHGKKNNLIFLNCLDKTHEFIRFDLDEHSLLLINSNVKHSLLHSQYNDRVNECNNVRSLLNNYHNNHKHLAQYSLEDLYKVKDSINQNEFNRAKFVIEENKRTIDTFNLIKEKKYKIIGDMIYKSHLGLRDLYDVSCNEIDFLVDQMMKNTNVLGSRMMGGGFGGSVLNLIKGTINESVLETLNIKYFKSFGKKITPIKIKIVDGVKEIK